MMDENTVRRGILRFLRKGYLINPYRSIEEHIQLVIKNEGCPCGHGKKDWRPGCPCKEAVGELAKDGTCLCAFFISHECKWPEVDMRAAKEMTRRLLDDGQTNGLA